jgi:hypothetical protein
VIVPTWFKKELAIIDPHYKVEFNDRYQYFTVFMLKEYVVENENGARKVSRYVPLATYRSLNDTALTDLRRRKQIGLRFQRTYAPEAYLDWIRAMGRESREKEQELALEMKTEGYMKIHRHETSHTVS